MKPTLSCLPWLCLRPRLQGDLHGFGSYLLAGAEIVRLQSKNSK